MRRVAVPRLLSNTAQAFTPLPSQQRSLRVPMLAVLTVPHLSPASPVTPVLSAQLVHPGPYRGWSAWHGRVPADRACLTVSRARHDRGGSGDTCSVTLHAPLRRRRASQSLQRCCQRHWVAGPDLPAGTAPARPTRRPALTGPANRAVTVTDMGHALRYNSLVLQMAAFGNCHG
jgi:hypothetical protein